MLNIISAMDKEIIFPSYLTKKEDAAKGSIYKYM